MILNTAIAPQAHTPETVIQAIRAVSPAVDGVGGAGGGSPQPSAWRAL